MLPPGGRNWQQISPHWMKYFVLQLNNKTQHFKVEKLAQTTFRYSLVIFYNSNVNYDSVSEITDVKL